MIMTKVQSTGVVLCSKVRYVGSLKYDLSALFLAANRDKEAAVRTLIDATGHRTNP